MTKENILFGVIGLLLGCIVGFLFANNVNQNAYQTASQGTVTAATTVPNAAAGQTGNLPPDHPPFGGAGGAAGAAGGAPLPQVTEAIKAAQDQPQNFEAQLNAADLYYQIQRYEDAAKFYERANQLRPESLETVVKLGNAYFDAERFELAEKWYSAALAKNPDDVNVRTDLGLTFFLREPRNIERAIKEYQTSLQKQPAHELTLQNLTVAYKEKGDVQAARQTLARLEQANPNNPAIATIKQGLN